MIEPTAALFYQIISEVLGSNSSLATKVINKIEIVNSADNPHIETLCIGKEGIIFINREFWTKHVRTRLDAQTVLLHELFHAITGDTAKLDTIPKDELMLANISMDMRINSAIVNTFLGPHVVSNNINSFILNNLYQPNGIMGLLRPYSQYGTASKFRILYHGLYHQSKLNDGETKNIEEIFENEETLRSTLKILIPKSQREPKYKIIYIGNHSSGNNGDEETDEEGSDKLKAKVKGKIIEVGELDEFTKQEIRDVMGEKLGDSKVAGFGSIAIDSLIKVIKSNKNINNKFLDQFSCNQKINVLKSFYKKEKRQSSVVPIRPSSRDISMLGADITPSIWHNLVDKKHTKNKNVAIYLDVSGSVTSYLPQLLGVISNLDPGIKTIYCFSNEISENTKEELQQGIFKTTGGTDFDCIIEHAIEKQINKLIILTDGYADVSSENRVKVKEHIKDVAMVYFSAYINRNNYLEQEYKKGFTLEELTGEVIA